MTSRSLPSTPPRLSHRASPAALVRGLRLSIAAVPAVALALASTPAFAQQANCPPGSWFCADTQEKPAACPRGRRPPAAAPPAAPAAATPSRLEPSSARRSAPRPRLPRRRRWSTSRRTRRRTSCTRRRHRRRTTARRLLTITARAPRSRSRVETSGAQPSPRSRTPGSGSQSNSTMSGAGFGLRYRPVPAFALEAGFDFLGGRDYNDNHRNETEFTVNAMVFVNPKSRVQVYFLAGLGGSWAHVDQGGGDFVDYTYFGGQAGGGLEFRLAKHFALDADLRGFVRARTDNDAQSSPEFVNPQTGATTNTSGGGLFTAGMTIYFLGRPLLSFVFRYLRDRVVGVGQRTGVRFPRPPSARLVSNEIQQPPTPARKRLGWALSAASGALFAQVAPPIDCVPMVWIGLAGFAYALDVAELSVRAVRRGRARARLRVRREPLRCSLRPDRDRALHPAPLRRRRRGHDAPRRSAGSPLGGRGDRAKQPRSRARPGAHRLRARRVRRNVRPVRLSVDSGGRGEPLAFAASARGSRRRTRRQLPHRPLRRAARVRPAPPRSPRKSPPRLRLRRARSLDPARPRTAQGRGARMASIEARRQHAPSLTVGLVDAAVPATTRWDAAAAPGILSALSSLSQSAERRGAELVVWPESAYPYVLPRGEAAARPPRRRGTPPTPAYAARSSVGRPCATTSGDGVQRSARRRRGRTDRHRVRQAPPPLVRRGGPPRQRAPLAAAHVRPRPRDAPGKEPKRLDVGHARLAPLICFEDLLPAAAKPRAPRPISSST